MAYLFKTWDLAKVDSSFIAAWEALVEAKNHNLLIIQKQIYCW